MQIEKQSIQIEKLTEENEKLRAELRHLKKQKGKPKIRPNVPDQTDQGEIPSEEDAQIKAPLRITAAATLPKVNGRVPVKQRYLPLRLIVKRSAKFPTHRNAGGSKASMIPFILRWLSNLSRLFTGVSTIGHLKE
ncbi:MAG: hypothetical protein QS721_11410 [Candidatus Endonucleobacter sp. (ex Gigantidas childressi)]|nr:hypothetical protein [Candidatus Endonucleobacter sp. (ex Gigantidas childressi)]